MKGFTISKIFLLLILTAFHKTNVSAQANAPESRTIYVNKGVLCQIDFTTQVNAEFASPKNSKDYYDLDYTNAKKALTISTKQENLPPTKLMVTETNAKRWIITVEYKDNIDRENESNYDFSDNTADNKKTGNNIILTATIDKLNLKPQKDPIPYSQEELAQLRKTYPKMEFQLAPPEQTFNLADTENDLAFNEDLSNKRPDLKLAFKSEFINIRLVCQNLVFKGNNGYLKLLIQNDMEDEFLTGNMLLTLMRQNGAVLNLHPGYIYPKLFPIIKPHFQTEIIYSFKAYDINDSDNLKFEIHDRDQKINVEFIIPGTEINKINRD